MRTRFTSYAFTIVACLLFGCAMEEDFPNASTYPYLKIVHTAADSTGIEVAAEIVTPGTANVKEYGFAYHLSRTQQEIRVPMLVAGRNIRAILKEGLINGELFRVSAYAVVGDQTVYSPSVLVKSMRTSKPVITGFSPQEGHSMSVVTITGTGFTDDRQNLQVYIGPQSATVVSADHIKIVVRVPDYNYWGSFPIRVIVNGLESGSEKQFFIVGPEVIKLSKYEGVPGDTLTLFGRNLAGGYGPRVQLKELPFEVLSGSETKVKLRIPASTSDEFDIPSPLYVFVGSKKIVTSFNFIIHSGFKAAAPLHLETYSTFFSTFNNHMPAFEADGKAYFFDNKRIISYTIANGNWREESSFPGEARNAPIWTRIGNKGYLLGGTGAGNSRHSDVWMYDFRTNTWQQLPDLQFEVGVAASFVLDSKLYFAENKYGSNPFKLWQYDPATQKAVGKNPVPGLVVNGSAFTRNNKAYLVSGQHLLVYDQLSDTWQGENQSVPDQGFTYTIGDTETYLLTKQYHAELYHYKADTKTWERVAFYPVCSMQPNAAQFSGFATADALYVGSFKANVTPGTCHNNFYTYKP